jgi:hypothetical protein
MGLHLHYWVESFNVKQEDFTQVIVWNCMLFSTTIILEKEAKKSIKNTLGSYVKTSMKYIVPTPVSTYT